MCEEPLPLCHRLKIKHLMCSLSLSFISIRYFGCLYTVTFTLPTENQGADWGKLPTRGSFCEQLKAFICLYATLHIHVFCSSRECFLVTLAAALLVCSIFMSFHSAFPCKSGSFNLVAWKIKPVIQWLLCKCWCKWLACHHTSTL